MKIETVIFDLGGVFFSWQDIPHKVSQSSLVNIRQIHQHPLWHDFETGRINEESLYTQLSSEISISREAMKSSMQDAFHSLEINQAVKNFLYRQKALGCNIICLSNIPQSYFGSLIEKFDLENIFDRIYLAFFLGFGKPNKAVFEYVLQQENLLPGNVLLIDDEENNIQAASQLGIRVIKYEPGCDLVEKINLIERSNNFCTTANNIKLELNTNSATEIICQKARSYLETSLKRYGFCRSFFSHKVMMEDPKEFSQEIFSTLLILDTDKNLSQNIRELLLDKVYGVVKAKSCSFFLQEAAEYFEPGKDYFPDDVDTTSLAFSLLLVDGRSSSENLILVTKNILGNSNNNGIIEVYFDRERPRLDPIVCANALNFLFLMGVKSHPIINSTKQYILDFLWEDRWKNGTRYYSSPDAFLYSLSGLVYRYPEYMKKFKSYLLRALTERVNCSERPLELAMRIISGYYLGLENRLDYLKLLDCQLSDGGWSMDSMFVAPKSQRQFGSRELTTAFALEAIRLMTQK